MEFHLIPKYRSLDVVEALKIKEIKFVNIAGADVTKLVPEDERFDELTLPFEFSLHHTLKPGGYWVRRANEASSSYVPAELIEGHYKQATEINPDVLKNIRAVVAKDLVSDEEVSKLSQMVYSELHDENQGVIGGPDVIHMQYPARLAEAVTELVLNKLAALA
jgi:D-aminopeptidase